MSPSITRVTLRADLRCSIRARRYGLDKVGDSSLQALARVDEPEAESVSSDVDGFSVDPLETEIIDYQGQREL